ncbi:MAG: hypothetical protein FLDDKLPJ_01675 [Phycisphaerae bacterium]|nr:hypothetical protein [Phycisphaerae bacterium]
MTTDIATLIQAAQEELDRQVAELSEQEARLLRTVTAKTATGNGSIAHTFKLDRRFRLVYVRCHFTGSLGSAAFRISVSSAGGSAYNTVLATVAAAGVNADVNQRMDALAEPSPWTICKGDAMRLDWVNPSPGLITWGLEVGLAPAS